MTGWDTQYLDACLPRPALCSAEVFDDAPVMQAQRLRTMLEQKNAECNRLQTEVRQAKEEAKSSLAQLQEAMQVGVYSVETWSRYLVLS